MIDQHRRLRISRGTIFFCSLILKKNQTRGHRVGLVFYLRLLRMYTNHIGCDPIVSVPGSCIAIPCLFTIAHIGGKGWAVNITSYKHNLI